MNSLLNAAYSNKCRYQTFAEGDNFYVLDQIYPKKVFVVEKRKREHDHSILNTRIILDIQYSFKQCWICENISLKNVFLTKNVKRTYIEFFIEFCIFELVFVPSLNLNWKFWFLGPNVSKNGISTFSKTIFRIFGANFIMMSISE